MGPHELRGRAMGIDRRLVSAQQTSPRVFLAKNFFQSITAYNEFRTSAPWCDLPNTFGLWDTVIFSMHVGGRLVPGYMTRNLQKEACPPRDVGLI